jgi:enamine deaminase RidA (YjgF/YER057c/UK114 family)
MSQVEARLQELGITLPPVPPRGGNYVPAVQTGNLLYTSGNVPHGAPAPKGRVGTDLTLEQGYEAARYCVLNCLASARSAIGDLDRIERVVKVLGFVNAGGDFNEFPKVVNGASDLLVEIFGEKGRHARSAVGLFVPGNFAVEVEIILELKPAA